MSERIEEKNISTKVESWVVTRWVYLRLLGIIHLMAFGSYALQIIGLNGSQGIIPTASFLHDVSLRLGAHYVGFEQVGVAGRMDVEQRDNRNFGGDMELNVVSDPN